MDDKTEPKGQKGGLTVPVTIDPRHHDAVVFAAEAVATQPATRVRAVVQNLHRSGVATAAVSPREALAAGGIFESFDVCVDDPGDESDQPVLTEAAARLNVRPGRCAVVASSAGGVAAGRIGGFALVIAVDDDGDELGAHGADLVIADLHEVTVRGGDRRMSALPDAFSALDRPDGPVTGRNLAVFFDFDGTLSQIVADPDSAQLEDGADDALTLLAGQCPVAVLSGRDLADIRARVGIDGIWYAGSHGFELTDPDGAHHENDAAATAIPVLADAATALHTRLAAIGGVVVEHKRFGVAVHYRSAERAHLDEVTATVRAAGQRHGLRVTTGREVIELRPDVDWDKGKTLRWIIDHVADDSGSLLPIYLGDDITDEDAFDAIAGDGVAIVVRHTDDGDRATAARFALADPAEVTEFTGQLARQLRGERGRT